MMKRILIICSIIICSLIFVACTSSEQKNETIPAENEETIEITHELDDQPVIVPKNPKKVVVFDIGALDTIAFLGEQERVIGFPKATIPNYLSEFAADKYENLGSLKEPEFEKIHAAQPDVIIISNRQMELYEQFKDIAPTIYIDIDTQNYVQSFEQNARLLGEIFNKEEEIEAELASIQEAIEQIKAQTEVANETALIVLGTEGKISAFGPASR